MKQVTVRLPNLGVASIEIPGLGVFENYTTTDVEDEQIEVFKILGGDWPEDQDEFILEPIMTYEPEAPVAETSEPASEEENSDA